MTAKTKTCRKCGAEFTASANDYTVNCPEHRGRPVVAAPAYDYVKAVNDRIAQVAREDARAGRAPREHSRGAGHPVYDAAYAAARRDNR